MSFKAEVIADSSGKWCGNALRFATAIEATAYASDLSTRWTAVRDKRVVESEDLVTARIVNNRLQRWNETTRCGKCHTTLNLKGCLNCQQCGGLLEETGWV